MLQSRRALKNNWKAHDIYLERLYNILRFSDLLVWCQAIQELIENYVCKLCDFGVGCNLDMPYWFVFTHNLPHTNSPIALQLIDRHRLKEARRKQQPDGCGALTQQHKTLCIMQILLSHDDRFHRLISSLDGNFFCSFVSFVLFLFLICTNLLIECTRFRMALSTPH